jgi:hypothetical protein
MFGNKDKRPAARDGRHAANAAFRAEVERLEPLPMAQLAAEVMVKGFGPGGYLPAEGFGVGYAPTRRGRAALEADAVEQTLCGVSAESA